MGVEHGSGQPQRHLDFTVLERPVKCAPEVPRLGQNESTQVTGLVAPERLPGPRCEIQVVRGVPPPYLLLAAFDEQLVRKLAHRFEHHQAWRTGAVRVDHPDKALFHQRLHRADDIGHGRGRTYRLSRLNGAATVTYAQAPEDLLFWRREQVIAPGDGVAH